MADQIRLICLLLASVILVLAGSSAAAMDDGGMRTYIVQMSKREKPSSHPTFRSWYHSTFAAARRAAAGNEFSEGFIHVYEGFLHVYEHVFWGFAARLTAREVEMLESMPSVLRVHPEGVRQLHTTHTPEFLGLNPTKGLLVDSDFGEDVIIGVIDTGVWPERSSFSDDGFGDIPSRWTGSCVDESSFDSSSCNKKLIGAKFYSKGYEASYGPINTSLEYRSPRDNEGHGTHTSSTCGGQAVKNASVLGFATGTARGIAPKARLAVYKVCWEPGCYDSDILAAFDEAVSDGVDVISLSVGGGVVPYYLDSIAIGAYGAMKKGVVVSCSAGNSGPGPLTVANVAPWIFTVAASTIDRKFPAIVKLGNGESYEGASLYGGKGLGTELIPFIYAGNAAIDGTPALLAALCVDGTLDPKKVEGKIVLCDRGLNARVGKGGVCQSAGAAGMVLRNLGVDGEGLLADAHVLPASAVGAEAGYQIAQYAITEKNPTALITFGGTTIGVEPAPVVASFSSRGPNLETPEILKPDITAPGVNILAAWTGAIGPTGLESDEREVDFNIISGTSMSCPHISGVAALIRGAHPTWSPAAIKSAMMTTSYVIDNSGVTIQDEATGLVTTPYGYGAGHVDPEKATDPGLIYELEPLDYIYFFCSLNYHDGAIQLLDPDVTSCPEDAPDSGGRPYDLNYPSFSALFSEPTGDETMNTTFTRTVTNVGPEDSTYTLSFTVPLGVQITVEPSELKFSKNQTKLTYTLYIEAQPVVLNSEANSALFIEGDETTSFGTLAWSDGSHTVQSPIVVTWPLTKVGGNRTPEHRSMSGKAAV